MTPLRKEHLINDQYYHIFSRSISKYEIFNDRDEHHRMLSLIKLYRHTNFNYKFSNFSDLTIKSQAQIIISIEQQYDYLVEVAAYCIMPTHIHLLLKQVADNGISKYMNRVLNGYSRYFNTKHHRVGPLWSSRFKSILVSTDEQLLHLTRYIHLNPFSAGLVSNPDDWIHSSYKEYINNENQTRSFCRYKKIITLSPEEYKKFVCDRKSYQKSLSLIKQQLIDDYTG